jgi:hypothetical protein
MSGKLADMCVIFSAIENPKIIRSPFQPLINPEEGDFRSMVDRFCDIDSMVLERGDPHGFQNALFITIINYFMKLT